MKLVQYWIEFDLSLNDPHPPGLLAGCGVTAYDYDDALQLIRERIFVTTALPHIKKVVEDIDISTLDANHVLTNMLVPIRRGIWFPAGYS
jgi:hypothetical protein